MDTITSISACGYVVADFDTASFSLSFSEVAPKSRDAKLKLKKGVKKITHTVDKLKKSGLEILKTHYRTNVSVGPNYVYDQSTHRNNIEGQKAFYTVTFQTPTLEMVDEVYDVLSELDLNEYTVGSPVFSLRKVSDLKQEALEDAWRVAQGLFVNQCKVLGKDPSNFSVSTWEVEYGGQANHGFAKARNFSNSAVGSAAAAPVAEEAIELNAGRSIVDVVLTVHYTKTGS